VGVAPPHLTDIKLSVRHAWKMGPGVLDVTRVQGSSTAKTLWPCRATPARWWRRGYHVAETPS
jgi:hypothetical protein